MLGCSIVETMMRPGRAERGVRQTEEGEIVGLGAAAGENQAVGGAIGQISAEQASDFFAGIFQNAAGAATGGMLASRIGVASAWPRPRRWQQRLPAAVARWN